MADMEPNNDVAEEAFIEVAGAGHVDAGGIQVAGHVDAGAGLVVAGAGLVDAGGIQVAGLVDAGAGLVVAGGIQVAGLVDAGAGHVVAGAGLVVAGGIQVAGHVDAGAGLVVAGGIQVYRVIGDGDIIGTDAGWPYAFELEDMLRKLPGSTEITFPEVTFPKGGNFKKFHVHVDDFTVEVIISQDHPKQRPLLKLLNQPKVLNSIKVVFHPVIKRNGQLKIEWTKDMDLVHIVREIYRITWFLKE